MYNIRSEAFSRSETNLHIEDIRSRRRKKFRQAGRQTRHKDRWTGLDKEGEKEEGLGLAGKLAGGSSASLLSIHDFIHLQIKEAFTLFDTDGSGLLDESEMRTAMFALGLASDGNRRSSHSGVSLNKDRRGGVTIVQFQEVLRGALQGHGGLGEIRMTFEAIVSCCDKGGDAGGGQNVLGDTNINESVTFDKLRRACQVTLYLSALGILVVSVINAVWSLS